MEGKKPLLEIRQERDYKSYTTITRTEKLICGVPKSVICGAPRYATDNTPLIRAYPWRTTWYATTKFELCVAHPFGTLLVCFSENKKKGQGRQPARPKAQPATYHPSRPK